ncbi:hypothetical protein ACFPRL_23285 [Pseudoclavibacter helvolus]
MATRPDGQQVARAGGGHENPGSCDEVRAAAATASGVESKVRGRLLDGTSGTATRVTATAGTSASATVRRSSRTVSATVCASSMIATCSTGRPRDRS